MNRIYKYLFSLLCICFVVSPVMGQTSNMSWPADGHWPVIVDDSVMIIGPKVDSLTEEQRYFNPVYLMVYPGKESLTKQMIRACMCDCDTNLSNRRIGIFSVGGDRRVSFSQGNLQYLPAANLWKFADNQYDYIGNSNKYITPSYRNWVDLFGYSASNTTAPFGVSNSTNAASYSGSFIDWGINAICGDEPGIWRTLTKNEWEYLLNKRTDAKRLRGLAQVNGVNGIVFLPDDWVEIPELEFKSNTTNYSQQSFTIQQWQLYEQRGAVFLPAAGRRDGKQLLDQNDYGNYWSIIKEDDKYADYLAFTSSDVYVDARQDIHFGRSVRLVYDSVIPEAIDLGLSVKWASFNLGAKAPEDGGAFYAWGETTTKSKYTVANYQHCDGKMTQLTKYCTNSDYGQVDNRIILDPSDDAATQQWAEDWRMPTDTEWEELLSSANTKWDWITLNGVKGYRVTSKKPGYTDNSIFLPAAGYRSSSNLYSVGSYGYYWSKSLYTGDPDGAWRTHIYSTEKYRSHSQNRYNGFSIRPVNGAIPLQLPTIQTIAATQIKDNSALLGGKVSRDGGALVTEYGVVYGTEKNPTTDDNKITSNSGIGQFYITLENLQSHTTYHARAYAINSQGTAYGTDVTFTTSIITTDTSGIENGHAYVDLGLSVYWATCNVGASTQEEYGDFFAWGETEPKEVYNWPKYKWSDDKGKIFYKYNTDITRGEIDNKTNLDSIDDAASVNWGSTWRTPTYVEHSELRSNCIWVWTTINGVKGHRVTSKKNGNSIFIPASGYISSKTITGRGTTAHYQSSSLRTQYTAETFSLYFRSSYISSSGISRLYGLPVRPVMGKVKASKPSVTTYHASRVTDSLAVVSGRVTYDGGANIIEHGVVYGLKKNPTITGDKVVSHDDLTKFYCQLPNLIKDTLYYARAYATNSQGTSYGSQVTFSTINHQTTEPMLTDSGFGYVDLGLSVMWATCNIGATATEQHGDYYAWGEIEPKNNYNWKTYKWCNNSDTALTKYCVNSKYGIVDDKVLLDHEDDAASVLWGASWHMPTDEEWTELRTECTWYWICKNDVNGYKVVGKNGNSIFLPISGYRLDKEYYDNETSGCYWSKSLHADFSRHTHCVIFDAAKIDKYYNGRCCGQVIRPVCPPPAPCKTIEVNGVSFNMMCVEGGTFMMGATDDDTDAEGNERPQHPVTLSDFMIGQTEVTQELWQAVMGSNPSTFKGDNLPVESVTWGDCQIFVAKLSQMTGLNFRLPTEAEWEYAAKGGQKSRGYKYAGSDNLDEVAWMESNSGNKTHNIGTKLPNELGIYDMTGNVWEWCADEHARYTEEPQINPFLTEESHIKNLRGGSWHNDKPTVVNRISNRSGWNSTQQSNFVGLRLVHDTIVPLIFTQADWDGAVNTWGHSGRAHAPVDQSCIQGRYVNGVRLKVGKEGSLNVYKVPSLLEITEDNFELVATLTTDSLGVQDFDFPSPIYVAENEYLVFGKPSEATPTLLPCYHLNLPKQQTAHYIGTDKAKKGGTNVSLMVDFY